MDESSSSSTTAHSKNSQYTSSDGAASSSSTLSPAAHDGFQRIISGEEHSLTVEAVPDEAFMDIPYIDCNAAAEKDSELPSWSWRDRPNLSIRLTRDDVAQDGERIFEKLLRRFWEQRGDRSARWNIVQDADSQDIRCTVTVEFKTAQGGASDQDILVEVTVPEYTVLIPRVISCFPMGPLITLHMDVAEGLGDQWGERGIFTAFAAAKGVRNLTIAGGSFCRLVSALLSTVEGQDVANSNIVKDTRQSSIDRMQERRRWTLFPTLETLEIVNMDLTRSLDGEARIAWTPSTLLLGVELSPEESSPVLTVLCRGLSRRRQGGFMPSLSITGDDTIISSDQARNLASYTRFIRLHIAQGITWEQTSGVVSSSSTLLHRS